MLGTFSLCKLFKQKMWAILVLCATLLAAVHSWPSQVPPNACASLLPVHPNENDGGKPFVAQSGKSPYRIQYSPQKGPNTPITVSIVGNSGNQIQGFEIQARDVASGQIVGQFREGNDNNLQAVGCGGTKDTASHKDKNNKPRITAIWQPNNFKGTIKFHITVLKSYDVFWVDQQSDVINVL